MKKHSIEVVTVEGSRHHTAWGDMSDDELAQAQNFLKGISDMVYLHMETTAGTTYFNPAHIVSVTILEREV
jgi:hypothetical protein